MDKGPELPNFNSDFCLRILKWGAAVCVAWLVLELLVLFAIGPGNNRCPGWIIYSTNGVATSLWVLVGLFTAAPTVWICYVVLRWDHFVQKAHDQFTGKTPPRTGLLGIKQDPATMFLVDSNKLCVRVTIAWCLFCAFPLWMTLTNCTD
jgi:hypothetical protein